MVGCNDAKMIVPEGQRSLANSEREAEYAFAKAELSCRSPYHYAGVVRHSRRKFHCGLLRGLLR